MVTIAEVNNNQEPTNDETTTIQNHQPHSLTKNAPKEMVAHSTGNPTSETRPTTTTTKDAHAREHSKLPHLSSPGATESAAQNSSSYSPRFLIPVRNAPSPQPLTPTPPVQQNSPMQEEQEVNDTTQPSPDDTPNPKEPAREEEDAGGGSSSYDPRYLRQVRNAPSPQPLSPVPTAPRPLTPPPEWHPPPTKTKNTTTRHQVSDDQKEPTSALDHQTDSPGLQTAISTQSTGTSQPMETTKEPAIPDVGATTIPVQATTQEGSTSPPRLDDDDNNQKEPTVATNDHNNLDSSIPPTNMTTTTTTSQVEVRTSSAAPSTVSTQEETTTTRPRMETGTSTTTKTPLSREEEERPRQEHPQPVQATNVHPNEKRQPKNAEHPSAERQPGIPKTRKTVILGRVIKPKGWSEEEVEESESPARRSSRNDDEDNDKEDKRPVASFPKHRASNRQQEEETNRRMTTRRQHRMSYQYIHKELPRQEQQQERRHRSRPNTRDPQGGSSYYHHHSAPPWPSYHHHPYYAPPPPPPPHFYYPTTAEHSTVPYVWEYPSSIPPGPPTHSLPHHHHHHAEVYPPPSMTTNTTAAAAVTASVTVPPPTRQQEGRRRRRPSASVQEEEEQEDPEHTTTTTTLLTTTTTTKTRTVLGAAAPKNRTTVPNSPRGGQQLRRRRHSSPNRIEEFLGPPKDVLPRNENDDHDKRKKNHEDATSPSLRRSSRPSKRPAAPFDTNATTITNTAPPTPPDYQQHADEVILLETQPASHRGRRRPSPSELVPQRLALRKHSNTTTKTATDPLLGSHPDEAHPPAGYHHNPHYDSNARNDSLPSVLVMATEPPSRRVTQQEESDGTSGRRRKRVRSKPPPLSPSDIDPATSLKSRTEDQSKQASNPLFVSNEGRVLHVSLPPSSLLHQGEESMVEYSGENGQQEDQNRSYHSEQKRRKRRKEGGWSKDDSEQESEQPDGRFNEMTGTHHDRNKSRRSSTNHHFVPITVQQSSHTINHDDDSQDNSLWQSAFTLFQSEYLPSWQAIYPTLSPSELVRALSHHWTNGISELEQQVYVDRADGLRRQFEQDQDMSEHTSYRGNGSSRRNSGMSSGNEPEGEAVDQPSYSAADPNPRQTKVFIPQTPYHVRPAGRAPRGKKWDPNKGEWVDIPVDPQKLAVDKLNKKPKGGFVMHQRPVGPAPTGYQWDPVEGKWVKSSRSPTSTKGSRRQTIRIGEPNEIQGKARTDTKETTKRANTQIPDSGNVQRENNARNPSEKQTSRNRDVRVKESTRDTTGTEVPDEIQTEARTDTKKTTKRVSTEIPDSGNVQREKIARNLSEKQTPRNHDVSVEESTRDTVGTELPDEIQNEARTDTRETTKRESTQMPDSGNVKTEKIARNLSEKQTPRNHDVSVEESTKDTVGTEVPDEIQTEARTDTRRANTQMPDSGNVQTEKIARNLSEKQTPRNHAVSVEESTRDAIGIEVPEEIQAEARIDTGETTKRESTQLPDSGNVEMENIARNPSEKETTRMHSEAPLEQEPGNLKMASQKRRPEGHRRDMERARKHTKGPIEKQPDSLKKPAQNQSTEENDDILLNLDEEERHRQQPRRSRPLSTPSPPRPPLHEPQARTQEGRVRQKLQEQQPQKPKGGGRQEPQQGQPARKRKGRPRQRPRSPVVPVLERTIPASERVVETTPVSTSTVATATSPTRRPEQDLAVWAQHNESTWEKEILFDDDDVVSDQEDAATNSVIRRLRLSGGYSTRGYVALSQFEIEAQEEGRMRADGCILPKEELKRDPVDFSFLIPHEGDEETALSPPGYEWDDQRGLWMPLLLYVPCEQCVPCCIPNDCGTCLSCQNNSRGNPYHPCRLRICVAPRRLQGAAAAVQQQQQQEEEEGGGGTPRARTAVGTRPTAVAAATR